LEAGTGSELVLTNVTTGDSIALRSNGAASQTTYNADGTRTVRSTGHRLIILTPLDNPSGPSTTLLVGRIVYTVDNAEVFDVQSITGRSTDLCAELSS
jgi:hypothetical protein